MRDPGDSCNKRAFCYTPGPMMLKNTARIPRLFVPGALVGILLVSGCKDPQLAEAEIPTVTVTAVTTLDGVTLDESASPQDVVYAFFRAAKADYEASQPPRNQQAQKEAFRLQVQLAAANAIKKQVDQLYARESLPVKHSRDEAVYQTVRVWTPIVAHYVDNFTDDRDAMVRKMATVRSDQNGTADVFFDVVREPSYARIKVSLRKEAGDDGKQYWRILSVGFADPRKSLPTASRATSQPSAK